MSSGVVDLVDPFGRTVRDLRISVTDRCNFRCTYCMPAEGMTWLPRDEVLTFEEFTRLARVFVERFGVDGIRLTGGEPTMRAHLRYWCKSWPNCGYRRIQPRRSLAESQTFRSPRTAPRSVWSRMT